MILSIITRIILFITVLGLQFNIQKSGDLVRVSTDGKKIALAKYAAELIGDHHPVSPVGLHHPWSVQSHQLALTGRLYWEVEAMHYADGHCLSTFGVMVTSSLGKDYPGADAESWGVELRCDTIKTTIVMRHAGVNLYEEVVCCVRGPHTHRYGQLLDCSSRSLSVLDAENSKIIYTFENVDTPKGITPVFGVYNSSTIRLAEPAKINEKPMLSFPVVQP